jgi:hypothetical protein
MQGMTADGTHFCVNMQYGQLPAMLLAVTQSIEFLMLHTMELII